MVSYDYPWPDWPEAWKKLDYTDRDEIITWILKCERKGGGIPLFNPDDIERACSDQGVPPLFPEELPKPLESSDIPFITGPMFQGKLF